MAKSTDLSDGPRVFVETRSPADVIIVVLAPGTEVDRMRLHVRLLVVVFPGAGAPPASTAVMA